MRSLSDVMLEQFAPTAEEEAKKINDQAGAGLVTDQSFWERQGIRTGEELAKSVLSQTYSDYYKEINGFRPRGWPQGRSIEQMSVDDIQALIDDLDEQATDAWYEQRHMDDQDMWHDDMIDAVKNNPEDLPDEWLEYDKVPQQQGMSRRPAGSKAQRRMESKRIKITKRQLVKLVTEAMAGKPGGGIDLAAIDGSPGSPSDSDISSAWPEGVAWNGHNVYEMVYKSGAQEAAWDLLQHDGYGDGQEAYLGYDPDSDVFVMGFDAFLDETDDGWGDYEEDYGSSGDSVMDGVTIELWPNENGSVDVGEGTVSSEPGGMYPAGLKGVKRAYPNIIDVRLD